MQATISEDILHVYNKIKEELKLYTHIPEKSRSKIYILRDRRRGRTTTMLD
jgi:hypothetical protein